jgi:hypothetical protein
MRRVVKASAARPSPERTGRENGRQGRAAGLRHSLPRNALRWAAAGTPTAICAADVEDIVDRAKSRFGQ